MRDYHKDLLSTALDKKAARMELESSMAEELAVYWQVELVAAP